MAWKKYLGVHIFILCMMVWGINFAWSQEVEGEKKPLQFPETEEEIIETLVKPPDSIMKGRGGLPSNGNSTDLFSSSKRMRGLAAIADDEAALVQAPRAGVLVLFDYNSATIKEASKPLLRTYGKVLEGELADAILIVAGHTDSKGSDIYNLALSQRRAEAVKKFLTAEFQIGENRLIVKPYGESKPIASNTTDQGRAKNRRVEFIRIQ